MTEKQSQRTKIDVSRPVTQMERLLRFTSSRERSEEIIALLRCWQHDEVLDDASREHARRLVSAFGRYPAIHDGAALWP